ncbi:hypothetical protein FA13DRAFT_1717490 [Coprinellus micaceus]|uniref:Uncharacterized protein n=1 Tax=Coprinellus micaceus TaxID=71717 RepID=A0A4Y7SFU5_COPMI|nr:hypothetical protein FA13DRAFT_1717490 [Coprinellus micaceus]
MLFNIKTLAITLLTSIAMAKAISVPNSQGSEEPFYERGFDDDEFDLAARDYESGLTARSHIDAALSSLTTRALLDELNDRLERRGKLTAAEQAREDAIKRCKKILANAAGKTIAKNALWPLEECLKKLFELEGVMPVANWKVAPTPPPSPGSSKVKAGRK